MATDPMCMQAVVVSSQYESRSPSPERALAACLAAAPRANLLYKAGPSPTGARRTWTADQLETLIRDKIQMKTTGGNGQMLTALRIFGAGASGKDITPQMFQSTITRLLNTDVSEEEAMDLFNKYDADGGGTLDANEFVEQLIPGPQPGLNPPAKGERPPAMASRSPPSEYVKMDGSMKHLAATYNSGGSGARSGADRAGLI